MSRPPPTSRACGTATAIATAIAISVAALTFSLWPTAAHASGDIGCTVSWKLRHRDFTGCDSMAMLSPGNDTRINLILLLARGRFRPSSAPHEVAPPGPLFDWPTFERWKFPSAPQLGDDGHAAGEGSRCLSDAAGNAAFGAALAAASQVTDGERSALVAARRSLRPICAEAAHGETAVAAAVAQARSPTARAFATYLQGASDFYAGDFDAAAALFGKGADDGEPWVRETSRYMLGRVEVNRAQVGLFDEFGTRDEKRAVDAKTTAAAETRLRDYLHAHPAGRYATSARGLLRRVYWLGGETAKLASEYAALLAQAPDARGLDDAALAEEIDTKLLPQLTAADTTDPILLAVLDLEAMRGDDKEAGSKAMIARADIEAQRPRFAREPALFEFLVAACAFYVDARPADVLKLIPDAAQQPEFDAIQFSRQTLRGMALDAAGDRNARGFWLETMPGAGPPLQRATVELALALHDERAAALDHVFASDSPIRDATIRDILLTDVAGAQLLRRQAVSASAGPHERAVALFTLLYKDLTRGSYRDFVSDVGSVPAGAANTPSIYNFVGTNDPSVGIFTRVPRAPTSPAPNCARVRPGLPGTRTIPPRSCASPSSSDSTISTASSSTRSRPPTNSGARRRCSRAGPSPASTSTGR